MSDDSGPVIMANSFCDWVLARNKTIKPLLVVYYWFATVSLENSEVKLPSFIYRFAL